DAGANWKMVDKNNAYAFVGVVDANIFLTSKGNGLLRSTDQGKEWRKASDYTPMSRVMQTMNGVHYFFASEMTDVEKKRPATFESFLIVSKDKGETWTKQGSPTDAAWGPIFGKDEKHIITLGRKGMIQESTDAGETWRAVIGVPAKGFDTSKPGWFTN